MLPANGGRASVLDVTRGKPDPFCQGFFTVSDDAVPDPSRCVGDPHRGLRTGRVVGFAEGIDSILFE
jgi:hypothetical protein